ncbi:MAG: hypothetical protein ACP5SH_08705, partial [Syntrophobacteraceae bacterium]
LPRNAPPLLGTPGETIRGNDIAVLSDGKPHPSVVRYHLAPSNLTGRSGIRDEVSRYEAIALTLVDVDDQSFGEPLQDYPPCDSRLHFNKLMPVIYTNYDLRFVYQAPDLKRWTGRKGWDDSSPVLSEWKADEYKLRTEVGSYEQDEDEPSCC